MPVVFTSTLGLGRQGGLSPTRSRLSSGTPGFTLSQTPQVYLDHQVYEEDGCLFYNWDYIEALFPAGMMAALFAAYGGLLRRLAAEPGAWAAPVDLALPEAQAEARRAAVSTRAFEQAGATLHGLFEARARSQPQALALTGPEGDLSYAQLARRAANLARSLDLQTAQPVALLLPKGQDQVIAALAVLRAGGAYVPICPDWPLKRRNAILRQAAITQAIARAADIQDLQVPKGVTLTPVDANRSDHGTQDWLPAPPRQKPDDLAYVIYTSGSTGTPKGVMIDHRGAVNTILDVNQRFAVSHHDRVLALSALHFDLSVYDIFGTLAQGAAIVMPERDMTRDPQAARDIARNARVTLWNSVPALVALQADLAEDQDQRLWPELRIVLMSGDWIPKALPGRLEALKPDLQIVSLGGATEASIWSNYHLIGSQDLQHWTSIPYGKPLTNQTMQVLDTDLRPCPDWVTGEIYIGGKGLALGYWADKDKTEQAFVTHPKTKERLYRTGDLGRMRPGALIEFLGRQDQQVKIAGHRIELGEIEAALASHPDIHHAIATTHKNKNGNIAIAAFVTPRPDAQTPKREDLRQHLQTLLPSYIIPASFQALDRFPLTSNGKVDRKALDALAVTAPQEPRQTAPPTSETERKISALIAELLDLEQVSRETNFFDLGATSVEIMRLHERLQRAFQSRIPILTLFQHPNIAALAAQLDDAEAESASGDALKARAARRRQKTRRRATTRGNGATSP